MDIVTRVAASEKHPNMYKTLDLIKLYDRDGDAVFFVVSGLATDDGRDGDPLDNSYTYEEHSCPTNYVPVEAIMQRNDADPHGVFEYVRSVWMPSDYQGNDEEMIMELFPEINS